MHKTFEIADICEHSNDIGALQIINHELLEEFLIYGPWLFKYEVVDHNLEHWKSFFNNPQPIIRYTYLCAVMYDYLNSNTHTYGELKAVLQRIIKEIVNVHDDGYGELIGDKAIQAYASTALDKLVSHRRMTKSLDSSYVTGFSPIVPYIGHIEKPLDIVKDAAIVGEEETLRRKIINAYYSIPVLMALFENASRVIEAWEIMKKSSGVIVTDILIPLPEIVQSYMTLVFAYLYPDKIGSREDHLRIENALSGEFESLLNTCMEYVPKDVAALENLAFYEDRQREALLDKMAATPMDTPLDRGKEKFFDIQKLINYIITSRRYRTNAFARSYFIGPNVKNVTYYDDYAILQPVPHKGTEDVPGPECEYLYCPVIDDAQFGRVVLLRLSKAGHIDVVTNFDDKMDPETIKSPDGALIAGKIGETSALDFDQKRDTFATEGLVRDILRKKDTVWVVTTAKRGLAYYDTMWDTKEDAIAGNFAYGISHGIMKVKQRGLPGTTVIHAIVRPVKGLNKKIKYHSGLKADHFEIVSILSEEKLSGLDVEKILASKGIKIEHISEKEITDAMKRYKPACKDALAILKKNFSQIKAPGIGTSQDMIENLRNLIEDEIHLDDTPLISGSVNLGYCDLAATISDVPYDTNKYLEMLSPLSLKIEDAVKASNSELQKKYPKGYTIEMDWDKFEFYVYLTINAFS